MSVGFEKYFRVVETGTEKGEEYYKLQYMKFLVSYLVSLTANHRFTLV